MTKGRVRFVLGRFRAAVRTGRDEKCSPERASTEAAADAPRHEPPRLDLFPRRLAGFDGLRRGDFLGVFAFFSHDLHLRLWRFRARLRLAANKVKLDIPPLR